ncbi:MAG: SPOR domain-containing protein [Bacteroidales bacterium]|jgi:cell division septation protein DedD
MKISIEKYIRELLYQYDCVIIPEFGGFIGNYSPALIDPIYHTFHPPFKSLLFNIHLKQNDGLLASSVSQAEQIPYEHAMDLIRMMLVDWNQELENKQELIIEKVGRIVKDTNGILQFEQEPAVNYLPEAFGLTTLVSPAIRRPGVQEKLEKKLDRYIKVSSERYGKLQQTLKWAAMMALPIGLAVYLSITNFDQIKNFHQNYTGFLFPNSNTVEKNSVSSLKILHPSNEAAQPATPTVKTEQPSASVTTSQVSILEANNSSETTVNKPYAIIVGAFRFRENADNMVAKLKEEGYEAVIYDVTKTGLFRVTVATYTTKNEAIEQLAIVRSKNYSSAWLLSK